jgi:hypothetical protein
MRLYVFVKLHEHVRVCELLLYSFDPEDEGLGTAHPTNDTVTHTRSTSSSGGTWFAVRHSTSFIGAVKEK